MRVTVVIRFLVRTDRKINLVFGLTIRASYTILIVSSCAQGYHMPPTHVHCPRPSALTLLRYYAFLFAVDVAFTYPYRRYVVQVSATFLTVEPCVISDTFPWKTRKTSNAYQSRSRIVSREYLTVASQLFIMNKPYANLCRCVNFSPSNRFGLERFSNPKT